MASRVFISYSSRDRADALDLKSLLEESGSEVWLDIFDIRPTALLSQELAENVEQAGIVCLLLSPTSVASKWVKQEIEHALERGAALRVLPVILRPCSIPDSLGDLVGIDATAGLNDEVVRLRLLRWIRGEEAADDQVLLDAEKRRLLAAQATQLEADRKIPEVRERLEAVMNDPIREITISLEADSFPEAEHAVLELRLTFDPMFSQPMSVYFARFRERATWPEAFGLPEPSYRSFFGRSVARIQAAFRWFDRVEELVQTIDGSDLGDLPATWRLELDGAEFRPGGPGINLPQHCEIPPLATLARPSNGFELILHDPTAGVATPVDPSSTDVDLAANAGYAEREPPHVALFRTRHSREEFAMLGAPSLRDVAGSVEREALLGMYTASLPPSVPGRADRIRHVEQLLSQGAARTDEERALAARLSFSRANLASVRAQHRDAISGYMAAANLLQPAVFEGRAPYRDAMVLYQACANVVGYFLSRGDPAKAADYLDPVVAVAGKLRELDPAEPDFRRLWSDAMLKAAKAYGARGLREDAAGALVEHVDTLLAMSEEQRTADRVEDAQRAVRAGLDLAGRWGVEDLVQVDRWRREFDGAGSDDTRPGGAATDDVEAWLRPVELDGWPTHSVTSDLLRYELRIRDGWSDQPLLASTGQGIQHVYRGPSPVEWLVASFMDGADAASDMRHWVDVLVSVSGFPVLEMQTAFDPPPELVEWAYVGPSPRLAERLGADEAHAYQGLAKLASPGAVRLGRLYIVMARRLTLAWKFALAFESACPPGTPARIVESNDHARAGATFGELRLS